MTVGIMRSLCCKIEQRCKRNSAGQCADSGGEGDRLFDGLERSHYDEFWRKARGHEQIWCQPEFAVHTSGLLQVCLRISLSSNMRVQTLKYSASRILWCNRLSPLLHVPTHCAGIICNYSIHAPVYQLFGNIRLIYLKEMFNQEILL